MSSSPVTSLTLGALAEQLRGRLVGNATLRVTGLASPDEATGPTIMALAMEKTDLPRLAASRTRIAIVHQDAKVQDGVLDGYIAVRRPRHALATLTRLFDRPYHVHPGHHPSATVDPTATVGANVSLAPFVCIGPGAKIGDNTVLMAHVVIGAQAVVGKDCLLHPGVQVGERVRIGDRVIIHMNAVIGADGFSFVTAQESSIETAKTKGQVSTTATRTERVNSIGTVIINDDVEIGACATIDRATIAATVIGRGTKIDNQVVIAHNTTIGENCMISGQAGVAGSCVVGDRTVFGGQVGVSDHSTVGNDVVAAGRSKIVRGAPAKTVVVGIPAIPHLQQLSLHLNEARITRYLRRIDAIASRIDALEGKKRDTAGPQR